MNLTVKEIQAVIKDKVDNKVVAEHSDQGHFYRHLPTDQLFPSVTTKGSLLDNPHLKKWAANQAVLYIDSHLIPDNRNNSHQARYVLQGNKEEIFKAAVLSHQDQFEAAGDIGTRGHDIVDEYLIKWMATGKQPEDIKTFIKEDDYRLFAIARSAEMFCNDFGIEPIASELLVASAKYKFAGTLDSLMLVSFVKKKGNNPECKHKNLWNRSTRFPNWYACQDCGAHINKEFCLVDWKTSNSINKVEYAMQVSSYWWAFYEMTGIRPKYILIVRLDKGQAKYEVMQVVDRPKAFAAARHIFKVYDWLHSGQSKLGQLQPREKVKLYGTY